MHPARKPAYDLSLAVTAMLFAAGPASAQIFVQKTAEAGFAAAANANSVAVADYDLDGDLDVYVVNMLRHDPANPATWNRLYRNNGDGTFADQTVESGATAASVTGGDRRGMGNKFGAAWGDYDNDGDPDLFLTHVGPEILYRNNGDGTFTDVTAQAGVAGVTNAFESSSPVWLDYDNDGDLDIYVSTWIGPNILYENNADGTFRDVSAATGLDDDAFTWSTIPYDVNLDGLLDLYLVNDYGSNRLMVNQGDGTFADETAARGLEDGGHGMGVSLGDFDNNGSFDIYLTNIYREGLEWNPLFANDGTGHFTDRAAELGVEHADWAWGTVLFDCDHDGDLDLYVANGFLTQPAFHNRLFQNLLMETGEVAFSDISTESGTDGTAEARAAIAFDFDQDGDLDIMVANNRPGMNTAEENRPYLYENVSATGHWLQIDLGGTISNRSGFGAVLRIESSNGIVSRHNDGVGFLGQNDAPVHVGIGNAEVVDEIRVSWPSGLVESFTDIVVNQKIVLVEGQGIVVAAEDLETPGVNPLNARVYPNPFVDRASVEATFQEPGRYQLEVVNLLGQSIETRTVNAPAAGLHRISIPLAKLPPGVYAMRLTGGTRGESSIIIATKSR